MSDAKITSCDTKELALSAGAPTASGSSASHVEPFKPVGKPNPPDGIIVLKHAIFPRRTNTPFILGLRRKNGAVV